MRPLWSSAPLVGSNIISVVMPFLKFHLGADKHDRNGSGCAIAAQCPSNHGQPICPYAVKSSPVRMVNIRVYSSYGAGCSRLPLLYPSSTAYATQITLACHDQKRFWSEKKTNGCCLYTFTSLFRALIHPNLLHSFLSCFLFSYNLFIFSHTHSIALFYLRFPFKAYFSDLCLNLNFLLDTQGGVDNVGRHSLGSHVRRNGYFRQLWWNLRK